MIYPKKRLTVFDGFNFKFTIRFPYDDFEGYVQKFEGELFFRGEENAWDDDDEKLIGRISGYYLLLDNCWWDYYIEEMQGHPSPRNIIDDMDSDVSADLMCLFTDGFCIKPKYCRKFQYYPEDDTPPNILYIKRLEILAPYRGKKLGEALISNTIHIMGRRGDLVALRSFPLQMVQRSQSSSEEDSYWMCAMNLSAFPSNDEVARKKLNNYYKKLGFKEIHREKLMYLMV